MLANIWANQSPGKNPKEKQHNKEAQKDEPHKVEEG